MNAPRPKDNADDERWPLFYGKHLLIVVNDPLFFLSHRTNIARRAARAGLTVSVTTPKDKGVEEIEREGFRFYELPLTRWSANPVREVHSLVRIAILYKDIKPDIIHHVTIKPVIYGSLAAQWAKVPCVVNAISGLGQVFSPGNFLTQCRRMLVQLLYRRALAHPNTRVIFQNPDDRDHFIGEKLISETKSVLIKGAGIDAERFSPSPEPVTPPVVVFAARLLRDKGVSEFVESAQAVVARGIEARFVVAGTSVPGNPNSISEDDLNIWKEKTPVEFIGQCNDMQVLLRESHVMCLPSYYREGIPKALIEASACGLPVVTTDWPGCREIVRDGVNGLLVPPRDVEALTEALCKLINDRALRQKMGKEGRKIVLQEGYTDDAVTEATLSVYHSLLACHRKGTRSEK